MLNQNERLNNSEESNCNLNYGDLAPRHYQIKSEDALSLDVIDLFRDEEGNSHKHLSRADLILIFTLYKDGLLGFYDEYMGHIKTLINERGYSVVIKPHYYLKNIIG